MTVSHRPAKERREDPKMAALAPAFNQDTRPFSAFENARDAAAAITTRLTSINQNPMRKNLPLTFQASATQDPRHAHIIVTGEELSPRPVVIDFYYDSGSLGGETDPHNIDPETDNFIRTVCVQKQAAIDWPETERQLWTASITLLSPSQSIEDAALKIFSGVSEVIENRKAAQVPRHTLANFRSRPLEPET